MSRTFKFKYNQTRIAGTLDEDRYAFLTYVVQFYLEREIFQTKVAEKIKTHFVFNNFFFYNRAGYDIMWRKILEPGRPQITTWCMLTA
jgi:hypothetical protein